MPERRRRTIARWSAVLAAALLVGFVPGAATPAGAAAPGGPYHFDPAGLTTIFDTGAGRLSPGVPTPIPANTYVNLTARKPAKSVVGLTFAPCGGGAGRTIALSHGSSSLFFTGSATCMTADAETSLLVQRVATAGTVDDAGLRYVRLPEEPTVYAGEPRGGDYLLQYAVQVDLERWVPPGAGGIAVRIWARNDIATGMIGLDACDRPPGPPQFLAGTVGFGDLNVVHVRLASDGDRCLRLLKNPGTPPPSAIEVVLLGYFTDELATGGDVPPTFESRPVDRPGLVPREPARVLDTRLGIGAPAGAVAAGQTVTLDLSGAIGPDTAAVTLAVTATEPATDGYVTVFACADGRPASSNLNYRAGANVPNLVVVGPDPVGSICLFTSADTHLLADLSGTYEWEAGSGYLDEGPRRLLDTRNGIGAPAAPVAAASTTRLTIRARNGEIPTAVTANLTAVDAAGYGYVTAYPCDQGRPEVSSLNYVGGQTVAALSTVKLSATGELCLYSYGSTHLLVDLAGTYSASAAGRLLLGTPTRWFDSREVGITEAHSVWEFGLDPTLSGATAVITNLTATGVEEPGFLTGFACSPDLPEASNLNYAPGTDVANLAVVPIGPGSQAGRSFCLYNAGRTHELVDVVGWMTTETAWSTTIAGRAD